MRVLIPEIPGQPETKQLHIFLSNGDEFVFREMSNDEGHGLYIVAATKENITILPEHDHDDIITLIQTK